GKDDQQIIDFMVDRYGDFVRYKPALTGKTALLWFGPAGLLLAGGALTQGSNLLFFLLTSFQRRRGTLPVAEVDPAFEAEVATPAVPPAGE
ncbi:hypothetical protein LTR94_037585, partial [Friedmanniomyces endolithicus]